MAAAGSSETPSGGLLASPSDLARWMRVNLQRRSPTGSPSARSFERAQKVLTPAKLSDGEFVCDGYSLGWYSCSYNTKRVLMHPGGYPGVVSVTLLVPSLEAGLSIVTTSDSAMEGLQLELMKAFIGLAFGEEGEKARLQKAVADYPARLARTVASRREAIDKARADAGWGGWAWVPGRSELAPYLGRFSSERLGEMEVVQDSEGLEARLGALTMRLAPAQSHLFAASASPIDAPETFRYAEDLGSLQWDEETFTRVAHFAE